MCSAAMKELELEQQLLAHEDSVVARADVDETNSNNQPALRTADSKSPLFATALDKLKSVSLWFSDSPIPRRRNTVSVELEATSSYSGSWSVKLPFVSQSIDTSAGVIVNHHLRMQRRQDRLQVVRYIRSQHDIHQLQGVKDSQEKGSRMSDTSSAMALTDVDDVTANYIAYSSNTYYNDYYYSDDDTQWVSTDDASEPSEVETFNEVEDSASDMIVLRGKGFQQSLQQTSS